MFSMLMAMQSNKPSQYFPGFPPGMDPGTKKIIQHLWDRVNYLINEIDSAKSGGSGGVVGTGTGPKKTEVAIQAAQDALTQGSTFVGFGQNTSVPPDVTSVNLTASGVGYTITGSTSVGVIAVSSAATARAAINAAVDTGVTADTMVIPPVAPLTIPGSITWNSDGTIASFVQPS